MESSVRLQAIQNIGRVYINNVYLVELASKTELIVFIERANKKRGKVLPYFFSHFLLL